MSEGIMQVRRDMRAAAESLSAEEARYLVDAYYQMQKHRIASDNAVRAMSADGEPTAAVQWVADQAREIEGAIQTGLDRYSKRNPLGQWARSQKGIGPVLAAGLLAHIDLEKAQTAGALWRFAGLDPTSQWERGQKRPHNARLKTLCWKVGESFVKVSGYDDAYYGHVYRERREYEDARNEAGAFADQAAAVLKRTPGHAQRAIYAEGKLPPGHLHARAKRYAVKLFLSHYHAKGFELTGKTPPLPYPIAHGEHVHLIPVP